MGPTASNPPHGSLRTERIDSRLMREVVECWLARLQRVQPMPGREELLAVPSAVVGGEASVAEATPLARSVIPTAPDESGSARSITERIQALGLGALLEVCPAAGRELAAVARSVGALRDMAACARNSSADVAPARDLHDQLLPVAIQLVSAQFYCAVDRIRRVHGTVLSIGAAFEAAAALARAISEDVLRRGEAVDAMREGAAFDETRMVLAPGFSLRGDGRIAPRTFGIRAGGGAIHPRKAIVVPEGGGT